MCGGDDCRHESYEPVYYVLCPATSVNERRAISSDSAYIVLIWLQMPERRGFFNVRASVKASHFGKITKHFIKHQLDFIESFHQTLYV